MKLFKSRMNDLIVLLPGITGSILQKDSVDLWSPSVRAIFNAARTLGKNLAGMNLKGDDPELDDLGDGITASELVPDAVIVPGLVKLNGYTQLSAMIEERFEVRAGSLDKGDKPYPPANFFKFPYDWRRDNRVAARKLKRLIDLRLPQWQEYAGKDARVILIAHSMGGIIARYYLEVLGGREKCKALFTLGTPYGGSLKALDFLANGCRRYFIDLSETVATFTSVYQLLPIYKAVKTGAGCHKVAELDIDGVNVERAKAALAFHHQIMDSVDSRIEAGDKEPYNVLPVVGTYQPTLQSAELSRDRLTVSEALPPDVDRLLWHGDGTVPYLSATPHELHQSLRNSLCAETHGALQCSDIVLDFLHQQLQETQIKRPSLRGGTIGGPSRAALSLRVNDVYAADEPVVLRASLLEGEAESADVDRFRGDLTLLKATFEPVDSPGVQLRAEFIRDSDGWLLEHAPLPPGVYRVEVRTPKAGPVAPPPVHDLFEVMTTV